MNRARIGNLCLAGGAVALLAAIALGAIALCGVPWGPGGPQPLPITCVNNLKQIGLAFRTWAIDNDGRFPFHQSTNNGGTMELCGRAGGDGDSNAALHFRVMSNELSTPLILLCPKDRARTRARDFSTLRPENVTYVLRSGTNVTVAHPDAELVRCPLDGNILHCGGSVIRGPGPREGGHFSIRNLVESNGRLRPGVAQALAAGILGCALLVCGGRLRFRRPGP